MRRDPERHLKAESAPLSADPAAAKREIRSRVLAARSALSAEERARLSKAICTRAADLPELAAASVVMCFASFGSEVDTGPLISRILADGKTLGLPRVLSARRMTAYRVADPSADLVPGRWDIPEPREGLREITASDIDVVIVPGAAFGSHGERCGYGGGFYDTFLPLTRSTTPRVALAFDLQLVAELPTASHDLAVDIIVTETRLLRPHLL